MFGATNQRVVYTRVIGTNAETQTYSRLTSETEAEPVPAGLAQALYDAVSVLQYDGVLELTEEECSGAAAPGAVAESDAAGARSGRRWRRRSSGWRRRSTSGRRG